jgi:hypothetical protein
LPLPVSDGEPWESEPVVSAGVGMIVLLDASDDDELTELCSAPVVGAAVCSGLTDALGNDGASEVSGAAPPWPESTGSPGSLAVVSGSGSVDGEPVSGVAVAGVVTENAFVGTDVDVANVEPLAVGRGCLSTGTVRFAAWAGA